MRLPTLAVLAVPLVLGACSEPAPAPPSSAEAPADGVPALLAEGERLAAEGDPGGARSRLERALAALAREPGSDPALVVRARTGLGEVLSRLGDRAAAERELSAALGVAERVLGPRDPALQRARLALAETVFALGRAEVALALRRQARDALEPAPGAPSPGDPALRLRARLGLAQSLAAGGDTDGARALLRVTLDELEATRPPDDPDLARVRAAHDALL